MEVYSNVIGAKLLFTFSTFGRCSVMVPLTMTWSTCSSGKSTWICAWAGHHGTAVAPLLGVMGKPTADISKTYQNHTRNLRHGRLGRIKTLLISIAWTCSSPKFCLDVHPSILYICIYIYSIYIYMYIYIYISLSLSLCNCIYIICNIMGVNPIPRPRHERQGQGTELGRKASRGRHSLQVKIAHLAGLRCLPEFGLAIGCHYLHLRRRQPKDHQPCLGFETAMARGQPCDGKRDLGFFMMFHGRMDETRSSTFILV